VLYRLIYVSSAQKLLDASDIERMLARSRENNAAAGISGMLLYHDGGFFQVLEGMQTPIDHLFAKICSDERHKGVIALWQGPVEARLFGAWHMGFVPPPTWPTPMAEGIDLRGLMRSDAPWSRDRVLGPLIRRFLSSYRDLSAS